MAKRTLDTELGDPPISTEPPAVDPATGVPITVTPAIETPAATTTATEIPRDPALSASLSQPVVAPKKGQLPSNQDIANAGNRSIAAARNAGTVANAASEDNAAALGEQSAEETRMAEETRAMRERQQTALDNAREETKKAFEDASQMKVQDFYAGRPGQRVMSAIFAGLGGAASILGHQGGNSTYDMIKDAIDGHYKEQLRQINSAFKVAEEKGKLTDQQRLQYGEELANLQVEHAAVTRAAAAKVQSVAAQSKGKIDQAGAEQTAAKLFQDTQSALQDNEQQRAKLGLIKAETNLAYAKASTERVTKQDKITDAKVKYISSEMDKDEARIKGTTKTPGVVLIQQRVREIGNTLREATASGDPQSMKAAVASAKEQMAKLNTGAAPSHEQMKMLNDLSGGMATLEEKLKGAIGNPTATRQTMDGIVKFVDHADEAWTKMVDSGRALTVRKYLGDGKTIKGIATTPEQQAHVKSRLAGMFSETRTRTPEGEKPRYEEGGKAPESDTDVVTIQNTKGERKTVTRAEAKKLGAL